MKNSNKKKQNQTSQKGITLIALIITIIVMLILVGVTINVALNGGLFERGEKAAFQTGASTVKEQIELAKALKVMNAKEKTVEDYSDIVVGNLSGLDENTIKKYANKIVVAKNGDICYNPAKVSAEEKVWLEELGIKALAGGGTGGSTATIAYGQKYINVEEKDSYVIFLEDGTVQPDTFPDGVTKITYEVKIEEGKNIAYASLDGAAAIPYGVFNEDFTEFRITVGEEVIFILEGAELNIQYNQPYSGTIPQQNIKIEYIFTSDTDVTYKMTLGETPYELNYKYIIEDNGSIYVGGEERKLTNVLKVLKPGTEEYTFEGYFDDTKFMLNAKVGSTGGDDVTGVYETITFSSCILD